MNIEEYYKSKQLVLAYSLLNKDYNSCNRSEKNIINNKIKSNLKNYTSVPYIIDDNLFELRDKLKEFIRMNILTNKNLLHKERVCYIWFLRNGYIKEYNYIFYTTYYLNSSSSLNKRIFHILYDYFNDMICENNECNKKVKFKGFSVGYRRFCCIKCSKNEDEIKNINLFNGVNKSNEPLEMRDEKKFYWYTVRRLTDKIYKNNKHIINPNNLKIGRNGFEDSHQIDHIISIKEGYENKIDPKIIADISNLRVVHWTINNKKGSKNILDRECL